MFSPCSAKRRASDKDLAIRVSPTLELNYSTDCQNTYITSRKPKTSTPLKPNQGLDLEKKIHLNDLLRLFLYLEILYSND